MNTELKKAIFNYMADNHKQFSLVNNTTDEFRAYIYNANGDYLIGGEDVGEFIRQVDKLLK